MKIYDGSHDKKVLPTNRTVTVVSAYRVVCSQSDFMTIRQQGREDWSLYYCENGEMLFDGNSIKKGEVWIYPPHEPQRYYGVASDHTVYHYLHFTGSDIVSLLAGLGIETKKPFAAKHPSFPLLLEKIEADVQEYGPLAELQSEYHTLQLLSRIAKTEKRPASVGVIKRVTDTMEHSFIDKYDAACYADMLGVSRGRFNHLFKEVIGISPYSYYINLRMQNAAALLSATDLKIKDIAEKCGYDDPLYFSSLFKKHYNLSPTEFRKNNIVI